MDKYEFNIKAEQMRKQAEAGDYATAMKIADGIDWRRVPNVNLLSQVSEIYEKNREYGEAKEILLLAFERAPMGRGLLYKLVLLALKDKNVQEAEAYYQEFCDLAPEDNRKYYLQYRILKEKKVPTEQQIPPLKNYVEREIDENAMYELAELCHRAGRSAECVALCDRIMLLFGTGDAVDKAVRLKTELEGQPLSAYQQDLVNNRAQYEARLRLIAQEYQTSGAAAPGGEAPEEETVISYSGAGDQEDAGQYVSAAGAGRPDGAGASQAAGGYGGNAYAGGAGAGSTYAGGSGAGSAYAGGNGAGGLTVDVPGFVDQEDMSAQYNEERERRREAAEFRAAAAEAMQETEKPRIQDEIDAEIAAHIRLLEAEKGIVSPEPQVRPNVQVCEERPAYAERPVQGAAAAGEAVQPQAMPERAAERPDPQQTVSAVMGAISELAAERRPADPEAAAAAARAAEEAAAAKAAEEAAAARAAEEAAAARAAEEAAAAKAAEEAAAAKAAEEAAAAKAAEEAAAAKAAEEAAAAKAAEEAAAAKAAADAAAAAQAAEETAAAKAAEEAAAAAQAAEEAAAMRSAEAVAAKAAEAASAAAAEEAALDKTRVFPKLSRKDDPETANDSTKVLPDLKQVRGEAAETAGAAVATGTAAAGAAAAATGAAAAAAGTAAQAAAGVRGAAGTPVRTPGGYNSLVEGRTAEEGLQAAIKRLKSIHAVTGIQNPAARIKAGKLNKAGILRSAEKVTGKDLVIEEAGDLTRKSAEELLELIDRDNGSRTILLVDNPLQLSNLMKNCPELAAAFGADAAAAAAVGASAATVGAAAAAPAAKPAAAAKPAGKPASAAPAERPAAVEKPAERPVRAVERPSAAERPASAEKPAERPVRAVERPAAAPAAPAKPAGRPASAAPAARPAAEKPAAAERPAERPVRAVERPAAGGQEQKRRPLTNAEYAYSEEELEIDAFAHYASDYAKKIDCVITGKSMLALYERIEIMQEDGVRLTRKNAEALIEEAADRAEKPPLLRRIGSVFSHKYDKDGMLILKEDDFIL